MSRRRFVGAATASGLGLAAPHLFAQGPDTLAARLAKDPLRPRFHLLPAKNWMNDPNGPIYFEGKYHMFFQYNPQGAVWGNMSWNHAVSTDMLRWTNEPVAFTMTAGGPDAAGCFSGSCIAVDENHRKRVYAIYTGVVRSKENETIRNEGLQESQCLAWSDDVMLRRWTKLPKPVLPLPPAGIKVTGFRDPAVWKQGAWFYMTVGAGIEKVGGCVLLYRSKDLRAWEYLHPLASGEWNHKPTPNPCDDGEMWECPDFFALDGGHVLIYSTLGKVFWQSGMLDAESLRFRPTKTGLLDLDAFYAPKTQLDGQGRRILWGWIPERRPEAAMQAAGWAGMMSLPRLMSLDRDGTLRLRILPESETLRAGELPLSGPGVGTLPQASGEVLCVGSRGSSFTFTLSDGTTTLLNVTYSAEKHTIEADEKKITLKPNDEPTLHAFVDGSVIELVVSERIGYTKRFYYAMNTAPDVRVEVQGEGATLRLWKVSAISPDRLSGRGSPA